MRAVGLKVLKNKLSEYVRLAAGGETVLVTDRDRVVAELVPPRSGRSPLLPDALLAAAGRQARGASQPQLTWFRANRGQMVELAPYDDRLAAAARALTIPLVPL